MSTINSFWDHDAPKFLQERWLGKATSRFDMEETLAFLRRSLHGYQGKLLDIGCGPGFWLQPEILPDFTFRLGIDSSDAMLQLAKKTGANVIQADAHSLPLESNQFNAVIAIHVLEYSPNPQQFLAEARRILCPGGRCCIITKNKFGYPWKLAQKVSEKFSPNPLDFNCLTADDIASMWGSSPLDITWISARLITDLKDINDSANHALPVWMEYVALSIARLLRPVLVHHQIGKTLAWHIGVLLEK